MADESAGDRLVQSFLLWLFVIGPLAMGAVILAYLLLV